MPVILNGVDQNGVLGTTIEVAELGTLAKGSLIAGDGVGAPVERLAGAQNQIIKCDSAEPTALKWVDHATEHKHGGAAEVATVTPAANEIPKADGSGELADAWIKGSNITRHVALIDHDLLLNRVLGQHRIINDSSVLTTELFSASKINALTTGAAIKIAYEGEANTNAFADADVTTLGTAEQTANKNVNNGYAPLDGSALVPLANLPASVKTGSEYKGVWNASTNTPTLADGAGANGDYYRCSVAGSVDFGAGSISFNIGDLVLYNGTTTIWENISGNPDLVQSVAGKQGVVTLDAADVAETAGLKIFTSTERTKLTNIETAATADQTGAQIKTLYQAEANAYTDTKNTKLSGIETLATADQTDAQIKTAYQAQVALISQAVAEAGTATGIQSWSALRVAQAIASLESGGGIANVVDDLTPEFGGDMKANGFQLNLGKAPNVVATGTLTLTGGNHFTITGNTQINAINTRGIGTRVTFDFTGTPILGHHATNMILPAGKNIQMAAGDVLELLEYAANDWILIGYIPAAREIFLPDTNILIRRSTTQTIATSSYVKIQFATEDMDPNNDFDAVTNYRWKPPSGTFMVVVKATFDALADGKTAEALIYKNGGQVAGGTTIQSSARAYPLSNMTMVPVSFNGTTDYVEGFCWHDHGSNLDLNDSALYHSFISGFRIGD